MTSSRGFVRLGVLGLPLVSIAFAARDDVGLGAAILAAVLLVALPALAVAQLGMELPEELDTLSVYLSSALMIVGLGTASLLFGAGSPGLGVMGVGAVEPTTLIVGAVTATGAGLAILVGARLIAGREGWAETELVRLVMPATGVERAGFALVSLTAGFGEEIAYRGFLLALVATTFDDPVTAVALSSIAFGLLHAYQGVVGMTRTALIGVAFALIVLATGSVWPVVIGHVIINLVAGLVLGDWLLDTER